MNVTVECWKISVIGVLHTFKFWCYQTQKLSNKNNICWSHFRENCTVSIVLPSDLCPHNIWCKKTVCALSSCDICCDICPIVSLATRQCGDISGRGKKGQKSRFRGLAKQRNLNRSLLDVPLQINIWKNEASEDRSLHLFGPFKSVGWMSQQNEYMTIVLGSRAKGMPWYKGTRKKLTSLMKVDSKPASTGPATRCCLNLPQILSQRSLNSRLVGSSTVSPLGPASDRSPHSSTQAPLSGTWRKLKLRGISIEYVRNMKN